MFASVITLFILVIQLQEFSRIVLCHQLWLKTEADEIEKDKIASEMPVPHSLGKYF